MNIMIISSSICHGLKKGDILSVSGYGVMVVKDCDNVAATVRRPYFYERWWWALRRWFREQIISRWNYLKSWYATRRLIKRVSK